MKMHAGEFHIDERLVERLLAAQFPQLADLPISAVPSTGMVNAIYRPGDHLCARLPRVASWAKDLEKELTWLPIVQNMCFPYSKSATPSTTGQDARSRQLALGRLER
jgi:aminoglycoside phosphotransferase (APT) family kinase protein